MTRHRIIEATVWAVAAGTVMGSTWAWMRPGTGIPAEAGLVSQRPGEPRRIDAQMVRSAAMALRDRNPFRIERAPTNVRFGSPEVVPAPVVAEVQAERPDLMLAGIIGGPPWIALVEGIPGREAGVALREGDEMNGIRLDSFRGDTAVLSGLGTTWVLLPKRVWR